MSKLSHFTPSVCVRRQSPPLHFNLHLRFHLTFVDTEIESGVLATIGANYMQAGSTRQTASLPSSCVTTTGTRHTSHINQELSSTQPALCNHSSTE